MGATEEAETSEEATKTALFLGGGAPNFTLMSGAVLALHRSGIRFNVVSMAGAGAVVGLMYLVPKGMTPEEAMENTVNFGISDEIYQFFPINYKAFTKGGPSADAFNEYWASLPMVQDAAHQHGKSHMEKLQGDLLLFLGAMLCPTDLTPASLGLCGHPKFIDSLIDFDRLPHIEEQIEINAFRLRDRRVVDFQKGDITPDHLHAALSFPLIYPPHRIGNELYYEGAAFQCINPSLVPPKEIKDFIILQPMKKCQIVPPRDLWNAYSMSVMMPVTALALYGVDAVEEIAQMKPHERDEVVKNAINKLETKKGSQLKDFLTRYVHIGAQVDEKLRAEVSEGQMINQVIDLVLKSVDELRTKQFVEAAAQKESELRPLPSLPQAIKQNWFEAEFDIFEDHLPHVFDWTRSNLEYLFEVGYDAGLDIADRIKKKDAAKLKAKNEARAAENNG